MNIHKNAVLTPKRREQMVRCVTEEGCTLKAAAAAFKVSVRTVSKWVSRYRQGALDSLQDRSSRPKRLHRPTSGLLVKEVLKLRRQKLTGYAIARKTGLSRATVSRLLRRARLSRWRDLFPTAPVVRYERAKPGELLHIDIKKLGRFKVPGHRVTGSRRVRAHGHAGWEYVFVAIDDHSRLAHARILPDEKSDSAIAFLNQCVAHYQRFEVRIERLMTDNGPAFLSKAFGVACRQLGIKHITTRPYTPKTNGKAERFIQSSLREWAYGRCFASAADRAQQLPRWLHHYNWHRPHSSLGLNPPISRIPLSENNLLTLHT